MHNLIYKFLIKTFHFLSKGSQNVLPYLSFEFIIEVGVIEFHKAKE